MDFGFSGVIEKFEDHWGKRLTRLLLMLIALAVSAVCFGAIWEWFITPLLSFFETPLWGKRLSTIVWAAITIMVGIASGIHVAASMVSWRRKRQIDATLASAKSLLDDTERSHLRHKAEIEETLEMGQEMLGKAIEGMAKAGVTQRKSLEVVRMLLEASQRSVMSSADLTDGQRAQKLAELEHLGVLLFELGKDDDDDEERT